MSSASVVTAAAGAKPGEDAAPSEPASTSGAKERAAHEEQLLKLLLHPIPRTAKYSGQLAQNLSVVHGQWFIDPEAALRSTIRALYVIKHMLREDAHILVVNSSSVMAPLMQEAALSCMNPNVWFYSDKWVPGTLTNPANTRALFHPSQQPNRKLFASKGIRMTNPHCPNGDPATSPAPKSTWKDKWRLFDHSLSGMHSDEAEQLLDRIMGAERHLARAEIPGTLTGKLGSLRLMVVLDPTFNALAIKEAQQKNVFTIGLVNHHKDLSGVTFPVYARDNHPNFQHFFLDWLLKVVNVK